MKKNNSWIKYLSFLLVLIFPVMKVVHAGTVDTTISAADKAQFDQMLTPLAKIYKFIQYGATLVGAIFLTIGGITYMGSGTDMRKRDAAKNTMSFTLLGLAVIWAAPTAVGLITA